MGDAPVLNPAFESSARVVVDPVAHSAALLAATRALDARVSDEVRALAAGLRAIDPTALPLDGGARVAFWTNLYNALMRHAVVAYDLRAGSRVPLTVFSRAAYQVGGRAWTLHAIEHGVLRCDRPAPYTFWRPFGEGDPRRAVLPRGFDARVHFALNCAAASCPPIRAYTASALDAELDAATRAYVTAETVLERGRRAVRLPYLCSLYERDFGDARAALRWVARYLDAADRAWVEANLGGVSVSFGDYRWEVVR